MPALVDDMAESVTTAERWALYVARHTGGSYRALIPFAVAAGIVVVSRIDQGHDAV